MMDLFNGMVKKMKGGGGVTFAIDSHETEEALATTLERIDNEDGDEDRDEDNGEDECDCVVLKSLNLFI
jgi:hypothetical protein